METDNTSTDYLVNETIHIMVEEPNKKAEWFNKLQKIQIRDDVISDKDKFQFLQNIIKLLLGDRPESITIDPANKYIEDWGKILSQVSGFSTKNLIGESKSSNSKQTNNFLGLAYRETRIRAIGCGYEDILTTLTAEEIEVLEVFVVWEGIFGPPQCEQFGLDKRVLIDLCRRLVITSMEDEDGDPWYHIPEEIQNYIKERISKEKIKEINKRIARQLRRELFRIYDNYSLRSAPMELLKSTDGSPVNEEALDLSEALLITTFIEKALFQTENLQLAKLVASITQKLLKHAVLCGQFYDSYFNAVLLSRTYLAWGMVEESEKIMDDLLDAWKRDDPEGMVETLNRIKSAQDVSAQENLHKPTSPEEFAQELNHKLIELRKKNDVEGLANITYQLSDFFFNSRDLQKALDFNFQAESFALSCKNSMLLAVVLQLRGQIYIEGDFCQEAKNALDRALTVYRQIEIVPGIKETQALRGVVFFRLNRFKDAINACEEAMQISAKYHDLSFFLYAAYYMGKSLNGLWETELAFMAFKRIVNVGSRMNQESKAHKFVTEATREIDLLQKKYPSLKE